MKNFHEPRVFFYVLFKKTAFDTIIKLVSQIWTIEEMIAVLVKINLQNWNFDFVDTWGE